MFNILQRYLQIPIFNFSYCLIFVIAHRTSRLTVRFEIVSEKRYSLMRQNKVMGRCIEKCETIICVQLNVN